MFGENFGLIPISDRVRQHYGLRLYMHRDGSTTGRLSNRVVARLEGIADDMRSLNHMLAQCRRPGRLVEFIPAPKGKGYGIYVG